MGSNMVRLAAALCLATLVAATAGFAQEPKTPTPAQAAQQQRMTSCNAEASQRNLKGDARQNYMSGCLSGSMSQTTLMKVCNAQASQDKLASNDRKAYLSTCLKKSG
jgi:psiF repeat